MHIIAEYIRFYLTARTPAQVHSPILFPLLREMFDETKAYYAFREVESRRARLKVSDEVIVGPDLGAGSIRQKEKKRTIGDFASVALSSPRQCEMLFRLVRQIQPNCIVELGSALGISTCYLASGAPSAEVLSFDGNPQFLRNARQTCSELGISNVRFVEGAFDDTLQKMLHGDRRVDFAFIDGNHRLGPTLSYFDFLTSISSRDAVFVIDDIRWSDEMLEAWRALKSHALVRASVDAFSFGLLFLSPDFLQKIHLKLTPSRLKGGPVTG